MAFALTSRLPDIRGTGCVRGGARDTTQTVDATFFRDRDRPIFPARPIIGSGGWATVSLGAALQLDPVLDRPGRTLPLPIEADQCEPIRKGEFGVELRRERPATLQLGIFFN